MDACQRTRRRLRGDELNRSVRDNEERPGRGPGQPPGWVLQWYETPRQAFGKTAEFHGEHLGTGRLVFLEGRLQTRAYDDQNGIRRWVTSRCSTTGGRSSSSSLSGRLG